MQYAGVVPRTPPQVAAVGVAALLGAGGALGIAAIANDDSVPAPEVRVVAAQPSAVPASGPDEAASAASIVSVPAGQIQSAGADEAHTAAAIGTQEGSVAGGGPDEITTAGAVSNGQGF
jgi:hypothetical protein